MRSSKAPRPNFADGGRLSEDRFLWEKTPVMLHSIDRDLRLISVSDRWLEVLGYRRDEVIGRRSTDFLTEASRQLAQTQIIPEFLKTGVCKNVPYQFVHKDGTLIDVLLSAVAVRDARGELVRSVATSTEVTEIKQAEERLHEIESQYRALVEHVPAIVYTAALEPVGKMLYVSPQVQQVLGYTPREWLAQPNAWRESLHPDDRERILEIVQVPMMERASLSMEYRLRSKDRRWVWLRDDRKLVCDEDGKPLFIQGFAKDVSDRKVAAQARRVSEERFRRIVDTALEGVWVLDAEANTIYVNRRLTEMLKYSAEEMLGRPVFDFVDPMETATARRLFERRKKGI